MIYDPINPELDLSVKRTIKFKPYYRELNSDLWLREVDVSGKKLWIPRNISINAINPTDCGSFGFGSSLGWQARLHRNDSPKISKYFNILRLVREDVDKHEDVYQSELIHKAAIDKLDEAVEFLMGKFNSGAFKSHSDVDLNLNHILRKANKFKVPCFSVTLSLHENKKLSPFVRLSARTKYNDDILELKVKSIYLTRSSEKELADAIREISAVSEFMNDRIIAGIKPTMNDFEKLSSSCVIGFLNTNVSRLSGISLKEFIFSANEMIEKQYRWDMSRHPDAGTEISIDCESLHDRCISVLRVDHLGNRYQPRHFDYSCVGSAEVALLQARLHAWCVHDRTRPVDPRQRTMSSALYKPNKITDVVGVGCTFSRTDSAYVRASFVAYVDIPQKTKKYSTREFSWTQHAKPDLLSVYILARNCHLNSMGQSPVCYEQAKLELDEMTQRLIAQPLYGEISLKSKSLLLAKNDDVNCRRV